ncbi:hypothetical protein C2E21_8933 [Chlorella sorokiniana]|uniref:Uncharacterized protein n=1 Tax=Chlorella sorokiniana TaxID=3076 RepID=A0A2P6TCU5_CHLSO|nr:hypothetical protein C2E21_8933 [Chlorella sorokiniana]|eukprot:PRW20456.1 hypothetical protein C2E21_8933 [Chlorella sorokiniana]
MRCSDGTECTGSVDGGSPCTEGQSWKRERCHGRWDDRGCCDSKHYCSGGHKIRCPEGTKCWDSGDGECPCKRHRPKPDDCGDECNSDDWDKDHTCPDGDWKCTSDTTYCEGGREIKCPLDYVCKGYAPCVKRNPCPDDWDCPDCTGKTNLTCINNRDYCLDGRCLMCPEGTRCTGTDDPEKSPCTPEQPPEPCPGAYSDFECIDSRRYCLDNAIVECPNSKWCHPDSEDTPCQSDKPTEPTCSGENFECTDKNSFCHEGLVQKCPSDLICKGGPIPCVLEYDDTCSASDNSCLDWNDFCLGGWRYTCPEGYRCVKPEEEGQSPCIPEDWEDRYPRVDKRCWTDFDDYTCFDASHYCLDGMSVWCGRDKFCNPNAIDEDEPICVEKKPDLETCDEAGYGEWTCLNDRKFCHRGLVVECPEDFVCKGASPYPCVQRCPCDDCEDCWKDDDKKDDCGDEFCDHPTPQPHPSPSPDCPTCPVPHPSPKPDCQGPSCTKVVVITKVVIIKKYTCDGDGWSCKGNDYCDGGKHWGCPEGTKCDPNWDGKGGSCCRPVTDPCLCDGPRYNYECIDNRRFCLGGYIKSCPAGTYCMGSDNGGSPCKPLLKESNPCPNGNNCCTSKYEYCSGGNTYSCRGGHVCERFAPCVWPSYDPCIIDPTADGCWNDCDKYPNANGCPNDPCARDPKSCWWRTWPEQDDCNCKNRASRCYDYCCEFPNAPQCNWQTGGQATLGTLTNGATGTCDCANPVTAECAAQCNAQSLQQAAASCDCNAPATGECAAQCALQAEQAAVQQQQEQAQQLEQQQLEQQQLEQQQLEQQQLEQQQAQAQEQPQAQPAVAAAPQANL